MNQNQNNSLLQKNQNENDSLIQKLLVKVKIPDTDQDRKFTWLCNGIVVRTSDSTLNNTMGTDNNTATACVVR